MSSMMPPDVPAPLTRTSFDTHMYETLARQCGISFIAFDQHGRLHSLHGKVFDTTEVLSSASHGVDIDTVFANHPEHAQLYHRALLGESSTSLLHIDGSSFDTHIAPIYGQGGVVEGAIGVGTDITQRAEQHRESTDTSQQLNNLLSNSPDGIFILNRDFVIQRANPAVFACNTPEPIEGQVCHKRFFDYDEPCPYCPVRETFRTGQPAQSSCYHPRLGMHFSLASMPLFDMESGELIGAFETFRDITELHQYEEAVKAYEHDRLMLDSIPICCCLINEELGMIDCNQEAVTFFCCTDKEDVRQHFLDVFPEYQPDGRSSAEAVREIMHSTFQSMTTTRFEWMFQTLDGKLIPAEAILVPLIHEGRRMLAGYVRDLRAEKAMISEVEETHERMRMMFETSPLGCTMTDPDFQSIECNHEVLRMYGVKDKDEYQAKFFELSPEYQPCGRKSVELAQEHLHRAFTEGYDRFEWLHHTADGKPLPVEITIFKVVVRDKARVAGYIRDLSELKKAEWELAREQAELVLAKEAAEAASRTKSSFLANMSHEIRTPMNAILGLSYLALQDEPPLKQRDAFTKIHSAATGLLAIINDILDFSKIEARKLDLEYAPFSPCELVGGITDMLRFTADEKHIELTARIAPEIHYADMFMGDGARLRQILVNLLGNAVKFTVRGGVSLELELIPTPDYTEHNPYRAPHSLHFSVQDTGIGIAPEVLENLFQPFSQADGSITRRFGGTGLGLVISKQLVELMGGEITVTSTPNKGSTFSFSVPLERAHIDTSLPDVPYTSLEKLQGMRVLVVEDNEINQLIAESLLEQAGIVVKIAQNGIEAIEKVAAEPFDFVLMDIQMPIMDGLEATRRIRAMPGKRRLPIIAMTAHSMSNDHAKSMAAGMNAHITKPIDPQKLFNALLHWLN